MKPDPRKVQEIMDTILTTTKTETLLLIGMVQYYRDTWNILSHVLDPLIEADSGPKGIKQFGMKR